MCKSKEVTDDTEAKGNKRLVFTHAWWPVQNNRGTSFYANKLQKEWNTSITDKSSTLILKFFHPVCGQLIISYKSCYRQSVESDKDLPWFSFIQKLAHFLKHSDSKLKPTATLVLALYRALASWLFFRLWVFITPCDIFLRSDELFVTLVLVLWESIEMPSIWQNFLLTSSTYICFSASPNFSVRSALSF